MGASRSFMSRSPQRPTPLPSRRRRSLALAIAAALGGAPALLLAGPPALDPPPEPDANAPLPVVPDPPQPERFWLSVELIGPRGAQLDAASSLVEAPLSDALPRGGSPPGEYVGEVTGLANALRWIDAHAFGVAVAGELEVPGGELLRDHDVILTALVVTRVGPDPYPWPAANVVALPEGLTWQPASLAVARAPLFAIPAAALPPARERYRDVRLDDALWLLDERDSCSPEAACSSWAKVIVRRGDRFFAGWLPSTQVIPDDAWVGGPQERRFALRRGHRDTRSCSFALLEQRGERREAPVGIRREHLGDAWPEAAVEVLGEELIVLVGRDAALTRHIETTPAPVLAP